MEAHRRRQGAPLPLDELSDLTRVRDSFDAADAGVVEVEHANGGVVEDPEIRVRQRQRLEVFGLDHADVLARGDGWRGQSNRR